MPNYPQPSSQGGKNGTSSAATAAAAAARAKQAKEQAEMLAHNQKIPPYFVIGMAGLILIFTVFHWSRYLYSRYASKELRKSPLMKGQVAISRIIRQVLIRRVPGFTSVGHALLFFSYLGVNIALAVTNIDWSSLHEIGVRLGWLSVTNIAFITFLALKNTPLAFLTAYSYDRINVLHQAAGFTTITCMFLHAILISVGAKRSGYIKSLLEVPQQFAMTAASAALVILATALVVKRLRYEAFYLTHIIMYMIILISVGMHQPSFVLKAIIVTLVAASMWFSDRILRITRILWYSQDNDATITPLPHGGTRVVLRRSPSRAAPGTHCFLWIPTIRAMQTHPFTIVSVKPGSMELVIASYDGFTKGLHSYALKNPGSSLYASIDGPYGAIPDFSKIANKLIFIAGGSGASFTFGVALGTIRKLGISSQTTIDFIWTVKEHEALSWFSKELAELQAYPGINIILHTTQSTNFSAPLTNFTPSYEGEKGSAGTTPSQSPATIQGTFDVEKQPRLPTEPWESATSLPVLPGRPNVSSLVRGIVAQSGELDRIAIAACGPDSLMAAVRSTAASCIQVSGPSIELHCEQFGW